MCAWTHIRRLNVTGRHVLRHFELLTNCNTTVQGSYTTEFQLNRTFHSYLSQTDVIFLKQSESIVVQQQI